jgi:secondary thiamine-phosphate synthase enzyme
MRHGSSKRFSMTQQILLTLPEYGKGAHLITESVSAALPDLPDQGLLHVFILHTSAALAINENADETVRHDMDKAFDILVPENQSFYKHTVEGPDDMPAHVKSVLAGSSVTIPIRDNKLLLGTWQGIYLMEFRAQKHRRKLVLTVMS